MRLVNKRRCMMIFATGMVLLTLTGCTRDLNNNVTPYQEDTNIINNVVDDNNNQVVDDTKDVTKINPSNQEVTVTEKYEQEETVVENGGTLSDTYVENIVSKEVPIETNNNVMTEEETINYFENIESKIKEYANSENFQLYKDKASSLFITTVDFIFYNGEIKGVTFDSLSNSAKLKILNIAKRIDTTIMNKWPTYKEDVKTTSGKVFSNVTSKIGEGITYIDGKLSEAIGDEQYSSIKDSAAKAVDEIKDTASDIYEKGKDVAGDAKEKVKSWYENFRNKNNSEE